MDDRISSQAGWRIAQISDLDTKTAQELPAKPAGPRRGRSAQDSAAPLPACRRCGWQTSSNHIQELPESSVAPPAPCGLLAAAARVVAQSESRQLCKPLPPPAYP